MDDDNYVNPKALLQLLKTFPQDRDVYVGKPSLNRPIHASELQSKNRTVCPFLLLQLVVALVCVCVYSDTRGRTQRQSLVIW